MIRFVYQEFHSKVITSTKSKVEKYTAAEGARMDWLSSSSLVSPKLQMPRFHPHSLVAVVVGLVGAFNRQAEVVGLLSGEGGELDGQGAEVGSGNLFIKLLGEHVHVDSVLARVAPQLDLGEHLVGERGGHNKAGVTHGTAKVAIGKCEPVHLRLDVGLLLAV